MKKKVGIGLMMVAGLFVSAELISREALGLGDPPLTIRDPKIEYLFKPGVYRRFGNEVAYNEYSMRSPPPPDGSTPTTKVLVFGDSVVNGGALTDQSELATELLRQSLPHTWVGNVSAGSWGPGNIAAYLQRYGTFGASKIIVVLSSHDLEDVPSFPDELGPDFPEKRPALALAEALFRYVPRYLPGSAPGDAAPPPVPDAAAAGSGEQRLLELLTLLKAAGTDFHVFLHPTVTELRNGPDANRGRIVTLLDKEKVAYTDMSRRLSETDFRDDIHLSPSGHRAYASAFRELF